MGHRTIENNQYMKLHASKIFNYWAIGPLKIINICTYTLFNVLAMVCIDLAIDILKSGHKTIYLVVLLNLQQNSTYKNNCTYEGLSYYISKIS
jgi:hypothetical protein